MATMKGPMFRLFSLLVALVTISCSAEIFASAAKNLKDTESSLAARPFSFYKAAPPQKTRHYHFVVEETVHTVNCVKKTLLTVNGKYPGPTIEANEGDRIIVNVTNKSHTNMTVHFHGVRQVHTPWMDGVAYITMCPVQKGDYFVHNFTIPNQRATLLWHAHIGWQRASIHGAFITRPTSDWKELEFPGSHPIPVPGTPPKSRYPYPEPAGEYLMTFGEWFNEDVEKIELDGLAAGVPFPEADSITINGLPGVMYNCSLPSNTPRGSKVEGFSNLHVERGKTYLLRIINAALNTHLFFAVANHSLTVVDADGEYVQHYTTKLIFVSPGQTVGALLTATQKSGTFTMAANGYGRDEVPVGGVLKPTALLVYGKGPAVIAKNFAATLPYLANHTSIELVDEFTQAMHTLYPGRVPLTVTQEVFMTIGFSRLPCEKLPFAKNCKGDLRGVTEINNVTFEQPWVSIMEADFNVIPGVFTENFPYKEAKPWDWTGTSPPAAQTVSEYGTRVIGVEFNATVQVVLQNTIVSSFQNHPFHLHGHNFYELALGHGNYDPKTVTLNTHNPALRNTVAVPRGGFAVIRFKANNPGMWAFHCHLEKHTSWGMITVFNVHNRGSKCGGQYSYDCPPKHMTPC